jgi:hypothetical protein
MTNKSSCEAKIFTRAFDGAGLQLANSVYFAEPSNDLWSKMLTIKKINGAGSSNVADKGWFV